MHPLLLELLPQIRQGYCCSQLLLILMLQTLGKDAPDLLRASQGLCHGLGASNGPCGLLTGGACVLSLVTGKGADSEKAHAMQIPIINDYATWFTKQTAAFGGTGCEDILKGLGAFTPGKRDPNLLACGDLLAQCWDEICLLLNTYEIEI